MLEDILHLHRKVGMHRQWRQLRLSRNKAGPFHVHNDWVD